MTPDMVGKQVTVAGTVAVKDDLRVINVLSMDNRLFVALIDTTNAMCYLNTIVCICCIPIDVDINDKSTGALAGLKFSPLTAPAR